MAQVPLSIHIQRDFLLFYPVIEKGVRADLSSIRRMIKSNNNIKIHIKQIDTVF